MFDCDSFELKYYIEYLFKYENDEEIVSYLVNKLKFIDFN